MGRVGCNIGGRADERNEDWHCIEPSDEEVAARLKRQQHAKQTRDTVERLLADGFEARAAELSEIAAMPDAERRLFAAGLRSHVRCLPNAVPAYEVVYSAECPYHPFTCKHCENRAMEAVLRAPSFFGVARKESPLATGMLLSLATRRLADGTTDFESALRK
jgi:hypothetical protein